MVSFIVQEENTSEIPFFKMFWKPLVDYVMIRKLHSAGGLVKTKEAAVRNRSKEQTRYPCPHLWKRLTVDFDNHIKFCAHDWKSDNALGDITKSSIEEIWHGKALRELRRQHLKDDIKQTVICSQCIDWAASPWEFGYERLVDKVVFGRPILLSCLPLLK